MSDTALVFPEKWTDIIVPANGIDTVGQCAAIEYLDSLNLSIYGHLPSDWRWEWRVGGKGEYVGTFPKRVAKLVRAIYGRKLSAEELGLLGSKVAPHVGKVDGFTFRFTRHFDWDAGDYGDKGSCFWGCRSAARAMLADNGALAVQFRRDGRGYARAWVAPQDSQSVVIFNGYGLETLEVARILSHYWGLYYKRCHLSNNGSDTGTLWINGPGAGFLIAPPDRFDDTTPRIDLEWDEPETCIHCDCTYDEDSGAWFGNEWVCEECLGERYFLCSDCEEWAHNDNSYSVAGDRYVCGSCYFNYTPCHRCDVEFTQNELTEGPDGRYRCEGCHDDVVGTCNECNKEFLRNDLTEGPNGADYCEDCYTAIFPQCKECNEVCSLGTILRNGKTCQCETCANREAPANA